MIKPEVKHIGANELNYFDNDWWLLLIEMGVPFTAFLW